MVAILGGDFDFRVQGIEVEGSDQNGVDIAYPWENSPRRFHRHTMGVHPFFIDRHNVTNAEFKAFLDARITSPKTRRISSRIGRTAPIPTAGPTSP